MTPFEAVYGRSPPSLLDYIMGTSNIDVVDALLQSRTELISQLQSNISRAYYNHIDSLLWLFVTLRNSQSDSLVLSQQDPSEATWESLDDFHKDFPSFNLEDKVLLDAEDNDASQIIKEHKLKNQVKR
ncbi:hypothetical protein Tco_0513871 [Tanacetum coccineum]